MSFLKRLFGKKKPEEPIQEPEFSQEEHDKNYEEKLKGLEYLLGPMHDMVGHAIIPFQIGGAVDMYYFPNHIPGTGFATMELLDPDGNGPMTNSLGTYELLAFTRHLIKNEEHPETPFNIMERRVCGIFTTVGNYSFQAVLNPNETCEVPSNGAENRCLIFDHYSPENTSFIIGNRKHHLLLCLEVFRSEMEFARKNGSEALIEKLKLAGHYPYSDLDRKPVA